MRRQIETTLGATRAISTKFQFGGVIPGSYTVIAIEDGWDLEWSAPAVLAQYLKRGQTIEAGNGPAMAMHLEDAVAVQAK